MEVYELVVCFAVADASTNFAAHVTHTSWPPNRIGMDGFAREKRNEIESNLHNQLQTLHMNLKCLESCFEEIWKQYHTYKLNVQQLR